MDSLDYWRLCDKLSVIQAALLIVGTDPSPAQDWLHDQEPQNRPKGYDAVFAALTRTIHSEGLHADVQLLYPDEGGVVDWASTTVLVDDLRDWLSRRGIRTGFFFPGEVHAADYLDPNHPRYAPQLAASVHAWLATGSDDATKGKSPKQALVKWLRQHAAEYKLSDEEGKLNETGIKECAKVANWQKKGGAPKTPLG